MSWPRIFGPSGSTARERRSLLRNSGPHLRVLVRNPFDEHNTTEVDAIVDTGASCICISRRLVKELGLQRTGQTRLVAVGADHPAGVYAASLIVPALDFEKFLPVLAPDGAYTAPTILLGRTFLEHFVFSYNGPDGTFAFHTSASNAGPEHEFEE